MLLWRWKAYRCILLGPYFSFHMQHVTKKLFPAELELSEAFFTRKFSWFTATFHCKRFQSSFTKSVTKSGMGAGMRAGMTFCQKCGTRNFILRKHWASIIASQIWFQNAYIKSWASTFHLWVLCFKARFFFPTHFFKLRYLSEFLSDFNAYTLLFSGFSWSFRIFWQKLILRQFWSI